MSSLQGDTYSEPYYLEKCFTWCYTVCWETEVRATGLSRVVSESFETHFCKCFPLCYFHDGCNFRGTPHTQCLRTLDSTMSSPFGGGCFSLLTFGVSFKCARSRHAPVEERRSKVASKTPLDMWSSLIKQTGALLGAHTIWTEIKGRSLSSDVTVQLKHISCIAVLVYRDTTGLCH